ncbi:hypothetical protein B0H10DRAFT_2211557 [Mycena sp. CBHHK59/15]|nr:hypothetical protein B0H10DRAFT_2211557 [Mycena sp. CBHHK59/15]
MRSFTLAGWYASAIFPYITMPALQKLNLSCTSLNSEDLSRLQSFLSRSWCPLRELSLHHIPAWSLSTLPPLITLALAIIEAKTITRIFRRLTGSPGCLPRLHRVVMFYALTDLLWVRWRAPAEGLAQLLSFTPTMHCDGTAPSAGV